MTSDKPVSWQTAGIVALSLLLAATGIVLWISAARIAQSARSSHPQPTQQALSYFSIVQGSDESLATMEGVQETAQSTDVSISGIQPSSLPGARMETRLIQWDMQLEGSSRHLSDFFRKLPERLPGIHMEQMKVSQRPNERVQCLLRLSVEDKE